MIEVLALLTLLSALAADARPPPRLPLKPRSLVYDGLYAGRPFWSGAVSLLDGAVEETHTYAEAEAGGFHHSLYFRPATCERMSEGLSAFFWVDRDTGELHGDWRDTVPPAILARLRAQVTAVARRPFTDLPVVFRDTDERGDPLVFRASPFPLRKKPPIPSRRMLAATEVVDVPLDRVFASQGRVTERGLDLYQHAPGETPLVFAESDGTYTIADGHHRFTTAWLRGDPSLRSRVVRPEPGEDWGPP